MKLVDIILTIICGEASALILADLVKEYDPYSVIKWVLLFLMPVLAIILLWAADLIAKKYKFVLQLVRYLLIGILATLIDLEIFELLAWLVGAGAGIVLVSGTFKAVSYLTAVCFKFVGNKYWVFEETSSKGIKEKFLKFIIVTFIGLLFNVGAFLYFSKIVGPQFGISEDIWIKVSVILAAIVAVVWNFLSYKFIVFKKEVPILDTEPTDSNLYPKP
ncbi:GtrA family protein [Patescibacteria group bacterium]|nr:GtrA family protein [Patescibacteria group bacterium]